MKLEEKYLQGMNYSTYKKLVEHQAKNGLTSGPNQTDDYINYTKLNYQRMKRAEKTYPVSIDAIETDLIYWLIVTETWCGDAAQAIPVIEKLAALFKAKTKYLLRDENLDVIDQFLTNGNRSIPKLILMTKEFEAKASWGPSPAAAKALQLDYKNGKYASKDAYKRDLQAYYNENKGADTIGEIVPLLA
ncbi:MAG: thioredoxin family protein [Bacteroidetes bacterium]|nr:thioredoxin family protein [Bacteroidota bacterium]